MEKEYASLGTITTFKGFFTQLFLVATVICMDSPLLMVGQEKDTEKLEI